METLHTACNEQRHKNKADMRPSEENPCNFQPKQFTNSYRSNVKKKANLKNLRNYKWNMRCNLFCFSEKRTDMRAAFW